MTEAEQGWFDALVHQAQSIGFDKVTANELSGAILETVKEFYGDDLEWPVPDVALADEISYWGD